MESRDGQRSKRGSSQQVLDQLTFFFHQSVGIHYCASRSSCRPRLPEQSIPMAGHLALTAVISIKPGKDKRFLELFQNCADYTTKNEPYVLTYELSMAGPELGGKLTDVVVREVYADQAGYEKHMASAPVKTMIQAMEKEDLVESAKIVWQQPPKIGFSARL
ncbi:uncharacterized protein B0I36DRAFT_315108 [Microdochium trichocladiopsis]|uniref:ABM domain-containing protein n=1 Tax=Microdochium trichocladiopsis TaxID=1682393 RepID=A0A9P8YHA4_9PEZI|nr:uncharacterized protein B0I36DRAFT_315108 [Microdochium trichocladiopsis]KAH7037944.1 hypothetical protein B0I36DRAFT_315108 [Microdochium trichocladiopsis]